MERKKMVMGIPYSTDMTVDNGLCPQNNITAHFMLQFTWHRYILYIYFKHISINSIQNIKK